MRKILLGMAALAVLFTTELNLQAAIGNTSVAVSSEVKGDWMKAKDGAWAGMKDGKMYWYKLDKSAKLWWSADGKKWEEVKDGMWADKAGHWLKIGENKLWWSADMGKTWSEVPEWKWEGPKGEWYKFDKDWTVWVSHMKKM